MRAALLKTDTRQKPAERGVDRGSVRLDGK